MGELTADTETLPKTQPPLFALWISGFGPLGRSFVPLPVSNGVGGFELGSGGVWASPSSAAA